MRIDSYTGRIPALLLLASAAYSACLKPEAGQEWDRYVAAAEAKMKARSSGQAAFLWVDESAERRRRAQNGEVIIYETSPGMKRKAPGAWLHDWSGAAFIPGAKIEDVIAVMRNYNGYRDYYRPHVVSSRTIWRDGLTDRFSVLLVNQALVVKTAIETEGTASYTKVDDKRWYGESLSNRIQEIENFGHENERRLPAGEGTGLLWRLATFTRFEERDGGVYIELEAMALSRDIPLSLRFVLDPLVRRVSRNSLAESLEQTDKAVAKYLAQSGAPAENKAGGNSEASAPLRPAVGVRASFISQ